VNANERAHWLGTSPPLAVDGSESLTRTPEYATIESVITHSVRVRDRRERFGDEHVFAAECACGWSGDPRTGVTAERVARRDGELHLDSFRPPHGHRGRS
jgi:hypothetical protein